MRNLMGKELTRENDTEDDRWKEYFIQLLNGDEIREVGGDIKRERIEGNERVIKGGKAAGMDGIVVEMLKSGGISITDWLLKIFNKCMVSGVVPENWKAMCIVPVYKGKGDRIKYYMQMRQFWWLKQESISE